MRPYTAPDREEILALINSSSATNDLLKFNHRADRAHKNDVSHIAGINPGRKFLGRCQDRRDCLFVVLKVSQVLITDSAIFRRNARAVVRV